MKKRLRVVFIYLSIEVIIIIIVIIKVITNTVYLLAKKTLALAMS